jgi:WD40 repeat protein
MVRLRSTAYYVIVGLFCLTVSSYSHAREQAAGPTGIVQLGGEVSINAVALSHNSQLALTSGIAGEVTLWELSSGWQLRRLAGHTSNVTFVAFSGDDKLAVTTALDNTVRVWDLETGVATAVLSTAAADSVGYMGAGIFVAFLPGDDQVIVATLNGEILVFDVNTKTVVRTIGHSKGKITAATMSRDGRWLATAYTPDEGDLSIWDVKSGEQTSSVHINESGTNDTYELVRSMSFSEDAQQLAVSTGSLKPRLRCYSVPEFVKTREIQLTLEPVSTVIIGSTQLIVEDDRAGIDLWNLLDKRTEGPFVLAEPTRSFGNTTSKSGSLSLSKDGTKLLTGSSDGIARLWDIASRSEIKQLDGNVPTPSALAISRDKTLVGVGDRSGNVRIWSLISGVSLRSFRFPSPRDPEHEANVVETIEFSQDDKSVTASSLGSAEPIISWSLETGKQITQAVPGSLPSNSVVMTRKTSSDGLVEISQDAPQSDPGVVLGHGASDIRIRDLRRPQDGFSLPADTRNSYSFAISDDDGLALRALWDGPVQIWDIHSRRQLKILEGFDKRLPYGNIRVLEHPVFSPSGTFVAGALVGEHTIFVWDSHSGKLMPPLQGHLSDICGLAFGSDDDTLLSASADGTVRIWSIRKAKELAVLVNTGGEGWIVSNSDSMFDSDTLERDIGVHWVFSDDPFRALPLEIFMRDLYQPGLLAGLLGGKEFRPIQGLATLNRVQPLVKVEHVEWEDLARGVAKVAVEVTGNTDPGMKNGKTSTNPYDVRLFRDGQLVGWGPKTSVEWQLEPPPSGPDAKKNEELDLERWRAETEIKDLRPDGTKELTFLVQVPRRADLEQVVFTAYGFNEDRVKSTTASATLTVDKPLQARMGKAYVISVGVNRTENISAWKLSYAANDARQMTKVVGDKLEATKQFRQVVRVRLVSDAPGKQQAGEAAATKENLKAVLDVLAGRRSVDEPLKREIPNIDEVTKAEPEDLVLLTFSSHGYTDDRGAFHIVLWDIGKDTPQDNVTPELQGNSLSSDVLSGWLREVDAGDMTMIVDACHSEATVAAEGFKPGPMGSRGLGQLAYDKGMRILAASKSNEEAMELGGNIKQGLLSYALVEEGLVEGKAAKDGKVLMSGWLNYGAQEVPNLYKAGSVKGLKGEQALAPNGRDIIYLGNDQAPPSYQEPVLFDFVRQKTDTVLSAQ